MSEKQLNQRLLLIVAVIAIAAWMLYPPKEKLRPGLDIAGGVSMVFEIDDEGAKDDPNLAENVKTLLQKRVDPQGVYNLIWRVMGRNRIEIQMPLPPADAAKRRADFQTALDKLFETNIEKGALDATLRLPDAERPAAVLRFAGGSATREALLQTVIERQNAVLAAEAALRAGPQPPPATQEGEPGATQPASQPGKTLDELKVDVRNALEDLDDAVDAVLAINIDPRRFQDTLDMQEGSAARKTTLEELKQSHANLAPLIDAAVTAYGEWKKYRGFLDGPADLRRLLRGAGVLEFRILAEPSPENATKFDFLREQLHKNGPRVPRDANEGWFRIDNPLGFFNLTSLKRLNETEPKAFTHVVADKYNGEWYVLAKLGDENGLLRTNPRKWRLKNAFPFRDEHGKPAVSFELDVVGGDLFRELTGRNIEKQLCIFVDNVAYSSATIKSQIGTQGQITGDFSPEKVNYLVQTMQAGALPARLKDTPISERTLGSSLGDANLRQALRSGLIGAALVIVVMLGYYLLCGLIANFAMMMNILLVLAVMAMLGARFTLDGIAGIILGIGMAVDANVLIYERMREEKERGASLRMIIKNGYDKAFTTIFDSNVTTLLTSIILYYVGSEEVRGFGLTLGWGVVMNLFTSVFVTRTIFHLLLRYNLIRDIKLNKLIGVPTVNWYGLRRIFIPISLTVTLGGLVLMFMRSPNDYLDVEFLGGVSADIETRTPAGAPAFTDVEIDRRLKQVGGEIQADGRKLSQAVVEPVPGEPTAFSVSVPGVAAPRLAALLTEPLEDAGLLQRGGVEARSGQDSITIRVKDDRTADQIRAEIQALAAEAALAGENLQRANVSSVIEAGGDQTRGRFWNVTTTVTNKLLVQNALVAALGDRLQTRPQVHYVLRDSNGRPFPITDRRLENNVPGLPAGATGDVSEYIGGAAYYLDQLEPPQPVSADVAGSVYDRLRNMRMQPGYQDFPWRKFTVFGVTPAGKDPEGHDLYSGIVVAVVDPAYPYAEDPDRWLSEFAQKEQGLIQATLDTEQSLRKVTQFKPQIAAQAKTQATLALLLSWAMIIAYVWIRFGRAMYGFAGVIALVHDVLVALAAIAVSGWIGSANNPLLIEDFKINMTVIAALLTIIGFSINDTIVIFDRIRETRGRLGIITPKIINDSVNLSISRTLITSLTVFLVLLSMYVFGGSSIRGFNFCMLVGVITGVYSTVAIAAPLLLLRADRQELAAA
jgi:SecD/SecF fusion protein